MNLKNVMIKVTAIIVVTVIFVSCDEDFNSVGSDIVGGIDFNSLLFDESEIISKSEKLNKVQTSGLPVNLLGVYEDPIYGRADYDILSQVQLDQQNPTFGDAAVLDSIVINMPYFSTQSTEVVDDQTVVTYELDSIYGSSEMKIQIFESNYFLRDFDGDNLEERQLYYSDIFDPIANPGIEMQAEGKLLYEENNFIPSNKGIDLTIPDGDDEDTERDKLPTETPRFRALISSTKINDAGNEIPDPFGAEILQYFQEKILDKEGDVELSDPNNFRNFFRGIYIKAEPQNGIDGSLIFLNMNDADITFHYTFEKTDSTDEDDDGSTDDKVPEQSTITMSFANNIVNSIKNESDFVAEEGNLYLRGGQGSIAVIDLFGEDSDDDGVADQLQELRDNNWLINEANLTFYVNRPSGTGGDAEPERIYLYNMETGLPLVDYSLSSDNATNPVNSRLAYASRLERDSDDNGTLYTIKLTQHIINIINNDTDNVQLGLSVSQNVNITPIASVLSPDEDAIDQVPFSSVISHEGTVLFGSDSSSDNRLKLNIFYTEPIN